MHDFILFYWVWATLSTSLIHAIESFFGVLVPLNFASWFNLEYGIYHEVPVTFDQDRKFMWLERNIGKRQVRGYIASWICWIFFTYIVDYTVILNILAQLISTLIRNNFNGTLFSYTCVMVVVLGRRRKRKKTLHLNYCNPRFNYKKNKKILKLKTNGWILNDLLTLIIDTT